MNTSLPADAWLIDDRWSKAYALSAETHIGRASESSIILRDPVISRRHASVVREGDKYCLKAFGSAGTKVNGAPVESSCVLSEGDIVEIAFTTLRFTTFAPTGEMFVVERDTPTQIDRQKEGPTRATQKAVVVNAPPWRRRVLIIVLTVLALLVLVALIASARG